MTLGVAIFHALLFHEPELGVGVGVGLGVGSGPIVGEVVGEGPGVPLGEGEIDGLTVVVGLGGDFGLVSKTAGTIIATKQTIKIKTNHHFRAVELSK